MCFPPAVPPLPQSHARPRRCKLEALATPTEFLLRPVRVKLSISRRSAPLIFHLGRVMATELAVPRACRAWSQVRVLATVRPPETPAPGYPPAPFNRAASP